MCCGSWDRKESDTTEQLNWKNQSFFQHFKYINRHTVFWLPWFLMRSQLLIFWGSFAHELLFSSYFKVFSGLSQFNSDVSSCEPLWVCCNWNWLCCFDMQINVFIKFVTFWTIFKKILSFLFFSLVSPLWLQLCIFWYNWCFPVGLWCSSFFLIFFHSGPQTR